MRPLVGVMPLWDEERHSIWMLPGYMDGLSQAGATPIIFPLSRDAQELTRLVHLCDGILFTGGQDVSPALYGQEPLPGLVSCCPARDEMELIVLSAATKAGKSILGICRGIQFINAALGGSLYQDIPTQHSSTTPHRQCAPYDVPVHEVALRSPLSDCLGTGTLPVNSYHHQAVRQLAPGLEAMATAPDGIVEALHMPAHRFLWAVQWHPEFSYLSDESSRRIFKAFVSSMQR